MKLFKKIFVTFASLTLLGSAVACTPKEEAKLEKITITSEPTKKEYYVGDSLDLTGLEVTAFYSNSTFKVVEDYETSGFNSSVANPSVTVTVTYKSKTASFTVSVREALQEFSITYYVNSGTDFSMLETSTCVFPSRALEGNRVEIKAYAKDGYDYLGFYVHGQNVPDSFYDQFEDYSMKENEFSFIMPHSAVIVYLFAETHAERYEATFATVAHASFSFQGSLESPFKEGDKVQFNVVVDNGYEMVGLPFIVGDSSIEISVSSTYIYSFTMPAKAVEISANVQERVVETYKLTLDTVEHASITKHPRIVDLNNIEVDTLVVIYVVVENGYELVGEPFIVGDASITITRSESATNGWEFLMPAKDITFSCTVQSSAPETKYAVSFTSIPHITFTISGTSETSFAPNTYVSFYIDLDAGYRILGNPYVVGDPSIEVSKVAATVYSFQMPSKAVEITADVEAIPTYAVTLDNTVDHVTMAGQSDLTAVPAGSQVVITVVPDSGYELDGMPFIVGDSSVEVHKSSTVTNGYYFSMPEKNVTFSCTIVESVVSKYNVTFEEIQYVSFRQISPDHNPCVAGESFQFEVILAEGVSVASGPFVKGDSSITIGKDQYGVYFFDVPEKDVVITLTTSGLPKVLNHIIIDGTPKTEYTVGEQFVKPTIRAYFDNGHPSEIVTSEAAFSGYDMNVAGNYTVIVSYSKGGVTDTKSYDITVSGKTPSTSVELNRPYEFKLNASQTYRFVFLADGTGYYERQWGESRYAVYFNYSMTGSVLTATFDHYASGVSMSSFANPYKIFADGFSDYQAIELDIYTDSLSGYLLSVAAGAVTRQTTPLTFALAAE